MKLRKPLAGAAAALVLAAAVWYTFGERSTPAGQAPLVSLSTGTLQDLQTEFNRDANSTRVILLLSPT